MFLHLLRHAHAGDWSTWTGDDDARPLTDKGRGQAERLGRFLARQGFAPDRILTSPKVRAAETAGIVGRLLDVSVDIDDRLGGPLDLSVVERILDDHGDPETPVLVGHDPDLSELVATLVGAGGIPMRKGSLARIEVERPLAPGAGELRWLLSPDVLKRER
jgi:phosphohistidine phosphatase